MIIVVVITSDNDKNNIIDWAFFFVFKIMASVGWFIALSIIIIIMMISTSVINTIGSTNTYGSTLYNQISNVRVAHQWLTISAILGFVSVAVFIIILLIAIYADGLNVGTVESYITEPQGNISISQLSQAYNEELMLTVAGTTQNIVLIVLAILLIVMFIIGIMNILAATQLGTTNQTDDSVTYAYNLSIAGSVIYAMLVILMLIVVFLYVGIIHTRQGNLELLELYTKEAEKTTLVTSNKTSVFVR